MQFCWGRTLLIISCCRKVLLKECFVVKNRGQFSVVESEMSRIPRIKAHLLKDPQKGEEVTY